MIATERHSVILLSRTAKPDLTAQGINVRLVGSYTDHALLVSALQGVHTVISCITSSDDGFEKAQINLLEAAKEAGCKRFAP